MLNKAHCDDSDYSQKSQNRVICRKQTYYELKDVKLNRRLSNFDILGPLTNKLRQNQTQGDVPAFLKSAKKT